MAPSGPGRRGRCRILWPAATLGWLWVPPQRLWQMREVHPDSLLLPSTCGLALSACAQNLPFQPALQACPLGLPIDCLSQPFPLGCGHTFVGLSVRVSLSACVSFCLSPSVSVFVFFSAPIPVCVCGLNCEYMPKWCLCFLTQHAKFVNLACCGRLATFLMLATSRARLISKRGLGYVSAACACTSAHFVH